MLLCFVYPQFCCCCFVQLFCLEKCSFVPQILDKISSLFCNHIIIVFAVFFFNQEILNDTVLINIYSTAIFIAQPNSDEQKRKRTKIAYFETLLFKLWKQCLKNGI